ncbi:MAG: conjugal transfer protein TraN, partial [Gemmataceae bacterium]|nr:conjugal transfer protein TraN [Gemmataceae bacterium]
LGEHGITIELTDVARTWLAEQGYDPAFGARPLRRTLQKQVESPLSVTLLQGEFKDGDIVVVDYNENDGLIFMRIAQETANEVLFQVLDTGTTGFASPHNNCFDSGDFENWHTLSRVPLEVFQTAPSFTLTATGGGCPGSATATVTGIGDQALLITCPADGPQYPTLSWTVPTAAQACHDCWRLERTYGNSTVTASTCGPLEAQGCVPSGQKCVTEDCTSVERTYACYAGTSCGSYKDALVCSACIPDPPGPARCIDESYPANGDFLVAAGAMEGNVTLAKDKTAATQIFPGEPEGCTSNFLVDCCDAGSDQASDIGKAIDAAQYAMTAVRLGEVIMAAAPWIAQGAPVVSTIAQVGMDALASQLTSLMSLSWSGVFLVISVAIMLLQFLLQCSEDSIRASTKRHLRLCSEVGDFCSVDLLLFCGETTTNHCCFHTLLARIIQEQGRAQLGIGWGTAEHPNCRGLTVEELQAIDFTQMDMSEYIADLQQRIAVPTAEETEIRKGQVTGTDYPGHAATLIAQAGSLGPRIQADIVVPGDQGGASPSTTLTLTVLGSGSVGVSSGGQCSGGTCQVTVPMGEAITVTATPAAGWHFSGWTGPCAGMEACGITLTGKMALSATFSQDQFQLAVSAAGNGTVTSSPPGIDCRSGSCTALYFRGTIVTLTASADSGWNFMGWGGDCTGSGACQVTLDASRSVSASFGNRPVITAFGPTVSLPVPAGTTLTWLTTTSGGTPPVQYEYTREDNGVAQVVLPYGPNAAYTWVTTGGDVGMHRIQVAVRNSGSGAAYEDYRISDPFTILPPVEVTGTFPATASRGTSVTVTITGQSFRVGDTVTVSGGGITVSGVNTLNDSQLQATFSVDAGAAVGGRDVTVMDPAGASATGIGVFSVF